MPILRRRLALLFRRQQVRAWVRAAPAYRARACRGQAYSGELAQRSLRARHTPPHSAPGTGHISTHLISFSSVSLPVPLSVRFSCPLAVSLAGLNGRGVGAANMISHASLRVSHVPRSRRAGVRVRALLSTCSASMARAQAWARRSWKAHRRPRRMRRHVQAPRTTCGSGASRSSKRASAMNAVPTRQIL